MQTDRTKPYPTLRERVLAWRYGILMTALLGTLVLAPAAGPSFGLRTVPLLTTAILIAIVHAATGSKRLTRLGLLLVTLPLLSNALGLAVPGSTPGTLVNLAVTSTFLALAAGAILYDVVGESRVTLDKIFGAICVYLLIAFVWWLLYGIALLLDPLAFRTALPPVDLTHQLAELAYFSCVTLTTLGYGDVVPISPAARALASVEALIGQLYLTVLVARLVSLHIAHGTRD